MIVTSDRSEAIREDMTAAEHFLKRPYSLGAIRYNLEKYGWTTAFVKLQTSRSFKRLALAIDEFKPDIIYTYGALTALNPLICRRLFCRHKNFKVVHGWDDLYGELWRDVFGFLPGLFMRWFERQIIKRSDAVVTLSYYQQAKAKADWGVECKYIPNGADRPVFDRSAGSVKLEGQMNIVYTGDQAKWKRTADICEAMRHVPSEIKLYLTGAHYSYLDQYASDNCIFLGYLSKNDQLCVMEQADVLVCTANQDCNAKFHEYLVWGKPILGYDDRANLLFQNGRNALLTKDYPSAIMKLYNEPDLRKKLVGNAEADIRVYNWYEIAGLFDEYFKRELLK